MLVCLFSLSLYFSLLFPFAVLWPVGDVFILLGGRRVFLSFIVCVCVFFKGPAWNETRLKVCLWIFSRLNCLRRDEG